MNGAFTSFFALAEQDKRDVFEEAARRLGTWGTPLSGKSVGTGLRACPTPLNKGQPRRAGHPR